MRSINLTAAVFLALGLLLASPAAAQYGAHGQIPVTWEAPIAVPDDDTLCIGDGSDFCCSHDGTDSTCTSSTGDLTIDNTATTGSVYVRTGTDTSATGFGIQNDSGTPLFVVQGDGAVAVGTSSVLVGSESLLLSPIDCATTVNAEVDDVITVDIACVDAGGDAVTAPVSVVVELYEASTLAALASEDTIAESGDGATVRTLETGTALQVMTSAAGAAQITVTDTGGGSDTSRYLRTLDGGNIGGLRVIGSQDTITFDDQDASP